MTKKGLENYEKVIDAVFKYIQRIKEVGPQEWVFNESRDIGNMSFRFAEKGSPIQYCVGLARSMPHFKTPDAMQHLIRSKYVADDYPGERLSELVETLADPMKALFIVSSKSFKDENLPTHEKWYKFNYSLDKVPEERLVQLSQAEVPDNGKKLDLPPSNNLIAKNFDILPEDSSLSAKPQLVQ